MKRLLITILVLLMLLSLTACGAGTERGDAHEDTASQSAAIDNAEEEEPPYMTLQGNCLLTNNGLLFVDEGGEPIVLLDCSEAGGLFDGLESFDQIRVTVDGIAETYPCSAGCYGCEKLASGTVADVKIGTLLDLIGLGWLDADILDFAVEGIEPRQAELLASEGAPILESGDSFLTYCAITCGVPVKQVSLWTLDSQVSDEGELTLTCRQMIDSIGAVDAGKGFVVAGDYGETVPFLGLVFAFEDGGELLFYPQISGEDGSVFLTCYEGTNQ